MTTAPKPEEVRALADACASDWHAVRPHLVVDDELMAEAGYLGASAESRADFINGIRHGEVAHGITGGLS
ncbi:hypothetical protein [Delftia tsuruhatensis]|uniref:hypothetical protein n=1 Tax=Delftia tsuruhatensis TaxID=180282 RepID=UPI002260BECD|nr:hypothetical protein [Delftia tsuruhatensis]MCX7504509.1 hypothetical protein [Delftia tsuruhatensis]